MKILYLFFPFPINKITFKLINILCNFSDIHVYIKGKSGDMSQCERKIKDPMIAYSLQMRTRALTSNLQAYLLKTIAER